MLIPTIVAVSTLLAPIQADPLVGQWQGTLTEPDDRLEPVGLRIVRGADGQIAAWAESPSQERGPPVKNLTLSDGVVTFEIEGFQGRANVRLDGDTMTGVWESPQGDLPLTLKRVPTVPSAPQPQSP